MLPLAGRNAASRAMFFAAGGPLGSLAASLMGAAGLLTSRDAAWEPLWPFFQCLMTFGLADLAANLNPLRTAALYSDAARMRIAASPDAHARLFARDLVALSLHTGLRPRDWDTAAIVRAAKSSAGEEEHLDFLLLAYQMNADRGNAARAQHWMKLAVGEGMRLAAGEATKLAAGTAGQGQTLAARMPLFATQFAFYEAFAARNAVAARQWLDRASNDGSAAWHRAHAAVTLAEGNREASLSALGEALAAMPAPIAGIDLHEREIVEAFARECAGQRAGAALAA
jgi:hypothetical protein